MESRFKVGDRVICYSSMSNKAPYSITGVVVESGKSLDTVEVRCGPRDTRWYHEKQCRKINEDGSDYSDELFVSGGLTKREYFAGLAMQGMLANHLAWETGEICYEVTGPKKCAVDSIKFADALLAELENNQC